MISNIIAGIVALLGIVGTVVAWNLNPKRKIYAELDEIYAQLDKLYDKRDKALLKKDANALTGITRDIIRLCNRKAELLQRK